MGPTVRFFEGDLMSQHEAVLFDKCPLCGQAKISMEKPIRFPLSKPKINPCPNCSAEFSAVGEDKFRLAFCEPRKLAGKHDCKNRVFRGCYLDIVLSKTEWEKIAAGEEPSSFTEFSKTSARFRRGLLPAYPSKELPFPLEHEEIVHYTSFPVYLGEQAASGKASDGGSFFLTNKRIIFMYPFGKDVIRLENLDRVEDSPPGFLVKEKDSFEPHYFFPPQHDPVLAAVQGAMRNLKREEL